MGKEYALSSRGRKLQRSQRVNRLGYKNKQFAPVTCMPPCKLPGIRKTAGQPEKQTRLFFGLSGGFSLCALRTAGPASPACPEAEDGTPVSACVCCFYGLKRRFSASLLTQKRSVSLPIQFLFGNSIF